MSVEEMPPDLQFIWLVRKFGLDGGEIGVKMFSVINMLYWLLVIMTL
jgi:hypothetical protein